MGTNYYLRLKEDVFKDCHPTLRILKDDIIRYTSLHIGKCSISWRFMFQEQVGSFGKIDTFKKWENLILNEDFEVRDENDEIQDKTEFLEMIKNKQIDKPHDASLYFHYVSEDGYDFDIGEFS